MANETHDDVSTDAIPGLLYKNNSPGILPTLLFYTHGHRGLSYV